MMGRPESRIKSFSARTRPFPERRGLAALAIRALLWPREVEGRADQADVREGLWEVPDESSADRIVLLTQQPDVVAQAEEAFEVFDRLLLTARDRQVVRVPERAGQKRPLPRGQAILGDSRVVAGDKAVAHQVLLDGRQRPEDARVGRRQEPDQWDVEQARVEGLRAVGLHERVQFGVETELAHLAVNGGPSLAPVVDRALTPEDLDRLHGPVEGEPGHDLGMDELLSRAADLPDPLVRL